MKHTVKKVFAIVLAAALCLSFSGCYSENNSWSAKKGDETLSLGSYIYFLSSAYSLARPEVSPEEDVLKASIPDFIDESKELDAKTWIENRALNYVNSYFFIKEKFDEYGLSFSEEDQASIDSLTDSMWNYSKTTFEEMGISKTSLNQAYAVYNNMYEKVLETMYNKGGEKEIPEEELKTFFTENYTHYEYFSASLTKADEEGNSVDMTDEEKADAKEKLDQFVEQINKGDLSVEDAAKQYAADLLGGEENATYQTPVVLYNENLSDTFAEALKDLEDNKAALAETTSGYYLIRKLPIEEKYTEYMENESSKLQLFGYMKGDEFSDYVTEQANSLTGVELNQGAIGTVKLSKIVNDSNKKGTSSAEESSAASE